MFCAAPDCNGGNDVAPGELHYGCSIRAKGVGVTASASPTMRSRPGSRMKPMNSWERGVAGEQRPDGSFMPYLDRERNPMGVKEHAERRHDVAEQVQRLKTDPGVFATERA